MKFEASKELWKHQVLFGVYMGSIAYFLLFFFSTKEPRNPAEQISMGALVGMEFYFAIKQVFCMIHAYKEQTKDEEKTHSK